jgi:uncharacterized coiled-coil protein SlyX
VSLVTDILDRLSGVAQLKEKLQQQDRVLERMQTILLEQQRELSEVRGMVKALVAIRTDDPRANRS